MLIEYFPLEFEVHIHHQIGRIAAQAANQVLTQRIREAERNLVLNEFLEKKGTLITGIIQKVDDRRNVIVNIGKTDAVMPRKEQIPGEYYKPGNRIRVFVLNVKETTRLPQVIVSHAHPEIVREYEVLKLIVDGKSNNEIAEELTISAHTAKAHVCNIIQKLLVDDRTQAAVKALKEGLV